MRFFQLYGLYPSYKSRLRELRKGLTSYDELKRTLLADRYAAIHLLGPALAGESNAFVTAGNDEVLQRAWAAENGLKRNVSLEEILLNQLEAHRTEVLYNLDPMRFGNSLLRRLPGSVRRTIAWRAAPSKGGDFLAHDLIVNNFPNILKQYRRQGVRAEYMEVGHDPAMDEFAANRHRPTDILFVGGYSRHHRRRAAVLEAVAALSGRYSVSLHLDVSRLTRLAETPLGWLGPLAAHRRPRSVRAVERSPVFGLDLYRRIAESKVVINGSIDMAAEYRGNMRCWETMGCGALLLGEEGRYPDGMMPGVNMATFAHAGDLAISLERLLRSDSERCRMTDAGRDLVRTRYSKANQWALFLKLAS